MRRYIVLIAVLVSLVSDCLAQSFHWQPLNGPSKAVPSLIAVNPNGHIVAQFKHVWWTSNYGRQWKEYALNAAVRDSGTPTRTILTFSRSGRAFISQPDVSGEERSHLFRIGEDQEFADTLRRDFWRALTSDDSGRVIAVTTDSIFITVDDGITWRSQACPRSESINSVASNGRRSIVLATETGLLLSTDVGQSWRRVLSGITQGRYSEVQWKDNRFWALGDSAYYSDDDGQSWSLMPIVSAGGRELIHLAAESKSELAAIRNLHGERTTAFIRGAEVTESRLEGTGNGRYAIAVDSIGGVWSALGAERDQYRSVAPLAWTRMIGDTNWKLVPVPCARLTHLFATASGLIAVTGDNITYQHLIPYPYSFFRSRDSGRSWEIGGNIDPNDVVLSADSAGMLYEGTMDGKLSYSTDLGLTWVMFSAAFPANVKITATSWRGSLYAASRGIFKSLDNGLTWAQIDDGSLTADILTIKATDSVLVASTAVGIFTSSSGVAWTKVPGSFKADVLATSQHSILEARDSNIMRSTDNGRSWQSIRNKEIVHDAAIDSTGRALIGTAHGMSYMPVGSKVSVSINDSIGDRNIAHISILPTGAIFVSKNGEGLYRAMGSLPTLSVREHPQADVLRCFPNPATSEIHLDWSWLTDDVSVTAFDALGRSAVLPRIDNRTFGVNDLVNGMYILRLTSSMGSSITELMVQH